MRWRDRVEAGQDLARSLRKYRGKSAVVYGLPRGGVVVAAEVARELGLPLDVLIARKIGHPFNPEYAIGAVAEKGRPVLNQAEITSLDELWLRKAIAEQRREARRRRKLYLHGRRGHGAKGKTVVVVDDGIATGLTLRAAIAGLKAEKPKKIVVVVPVAPDDSAAEIETEVDEFTCLVRDKFYRGAVGSYYEYFEQTEDSEVVELLDELSDD